MDKGFLQPTSRTVDFSLRLKNSDEVITHRYFVQVTRHCFINTESILKMLIKLTLGIPVIRPKQKLIGLRLVFTNV